MQTMPQPATSSGVFRQFKEWVETPVPLEQSDPELAEHLRQIANRCHPVVRTLVVEGRSRLFVRHDGSRVIKHTQPPGRNDLCPCGSGKKYKKCCG